MSIKETKLQVRGPSFIIKKNAFKKEFIEENNQTRKSNNRLRKKSKISQLIFHKTKIRRKTICLVLSGMSNINLSHRKSKMSQLIAHKAKV